MPNENATIRNRLRLEKGQCCFGYLIVYMWPVIIIIRILSFCIKSCSFFACSIYESNDRCIKNSGWAAWRDESTCKKIFKSILKKQGWWM
jgi:hypothetical protein